MESISFTLTSPKARNGDGSAGSCRLLMEIETGAVFALETYC